MTGILYSGARADADGTVTVFTRQDSALLSVLAEANSLVIRAPHAAPAEAGDDPALVVHLQVSPAVAAARIGPAAAIRPLLAGSNPAAAIENLRVAREATYLQANHTVSVDLLSPVESASIIVALASRGERD